VYAETALGTQGAEYGEIRYNDCEIKVEEKQSVANPNTGHDNWADVSDRPVRYNGHMADAVTLSAHLRSGAAATDKPPIIEFLESAGMTSVTNVADTVGTGGSGTFVLTTGGATEAAPGMIVGVALPTYGYYPTLVGDNTAKTVTPMMDLPEAAAGSGSKCCKMFTVYPYSQAVGATATLQFAKFTRGQHTTAPDLAITAAGCGCTKISPIVIEPAKPVELSFSFGATSVALSAVTLPTPTFIDSEKFQVVGGYFSHGSSATTVGAAAGITYASAALLKAEIDLGITVAPIPGNGATTCVSGIQGYWSQVANPKVTITRLHTSQVELNQWKETVADAPYYFHFVQPSANTSNPMWGIFCPCCWLDGTPVIDFKSADYITSTTTYAMTSPRLDVATEAPNTASTVPWYLGVGLPA
jgi:hypothetical protein